jgi:hypothetical protein
MISLIHHPDGPERLGDLLIEDLFKADPKWTGPTNSQGYGKMDREGVGMRCGPSVDPRVAA